MLKSYFPIKAVSNVPFTSLITGIWLKKRIVVVVVKEQLASGNGLWGLVLHCVSDWL